MVSLVSLGTTGIANPTRDSWYHLYHVVPLVTLGTTGITWSNNWYHMAPLIPLESLCITGISWYHWFTWYNLCHMKCRYHWHHRVAMLSRDTMWYQGDLFWDLVLGPFLAIFSATVGLMYIIYHAWEAEFRHAGGCHTQMVM